MTNIFGISAYYHDSAAALVRDGDIIVAAQEERFSRKKHGSRFPGAAIAYCLRENRFDLAGIDFIVFCDKPLIKFERLHETCLVYAPVDEAGRDYQCRGDQGGVRQCLLPGGISDGNGDEAYGERLPMRQWTAALRSYRRPSQSSTVNDMERPF